MSVADPAPPAATSTHPSTVACIEVGASGCETAVVGVDGDLRHVAGVGDVDAASLLIAVPGLISGHRVLAASNLGWYDADPAAMLGLTGRVRLVRNDAEAAALGEFALRGAGPDLLFVGLGTGVGGAVVRTGSVRGNLLGHRTGFGDRRCRCGSIGCLETVAAGWSLPERLDAAASRAVAEALAAAVRAEPEAGGIDLVVLGGGITAAYPDLVGLVAAALPDRTIEGSAAPGTVKSAAAWGLLHEFKTASSGP